MTINLQASGGLWRASQDERTQIANWREGFGLVGLFNCSYLAEFVYVVFLGGRDLSFFIGYFFSGFKFRTGYFLFWLNRVR